MPLPETTSHSLATRFERIAAGQEAEPHAVLGLHEGVVRTWQPGALTVRIVVPGADPIDAVTVHPGGLFEAAVPAGTTGYLVEVDHPGGTRILDDPYRFLPTLGPVDEHLIGEGTHRALWRVLGARCLDHEGVAGVAFAVWAPTARSVRVVGDWNGWDGRVHPMRTLGRSGHWELFVPGLGAGARYKFEILTRDRRILLKADPMARQAQVPPGTASIVAAESTHAWGDDTWMNEREGSAADRLHQQISIYEVHLASWRHAVEPESGGAGGTEGTVTTRSLTYRELAQELPGYVAGLGFTHVELLPIAEHPFGGSWGYQVTSYYAPTSRFGTPDDFRALVDALHRAGIGVIADWVPAHFPKDEWALARFDGSALYEHADPRQGEHPDWGTLVFNFGRNEVRNFLVANALYWLEEFHIDGLRVDAVASMLYLDYSREPGEWVPNRFGGRENLDAIEFLHQLNTVVYGEYPGAMVIAEESTSWPAVSRPVHLGGLGFGFKWNMGWMHDTLGYFSHAPIHRRWHHNQLTFGLLYAYSEHFVLPLSHDEVVHLKGSMLNKMPGDRWQQFANLRALYAWMWAHPGKQLLFMGGEIAQEHEWDHDRSLDWHLLDHGPGAEGHAGVQRCVGDLNRVARSLPALWECDAEPEGFRWIDADDADDNVLSFLRFPGLSTKPPGSGARIVACVANLSPVVRRAYRIGLPHAGQWDEVFNSDASAYGGSNVGNGGAVTAEEFGFHGLPASAEVTLPPLGVIWLAG